MRVVNSPTPAAGWRVGRAEPAASLVWFPTAYFPLRLGVLCKLLKSERKGFLKVKELSRSKANKSARLDGSRAANGIWSLSPLGQQLRAGPGGLIIAEKATCGILGAAVVLFLPHQRFVHLMAPSDLLLSPEGWHAMLGGKRFL